MPFLTIAALLAGLDTIYHTHEAFKDLTILPAILIETKRDRDTERTIELFKTPANPGEAEKLIGSPKPKRTRAKGDPEKEP